MVRQGAEIAWRQSCADQGPGSRLLVSTGRTFVCMFTGLNTFLERRVIIITNKTLRRSRFDGIVWARVFSHVG